jgi:hypothetical protein
METRLLCWDERAFYVEHRFVTGKSKDQSFVNAIVIVKNSVLGKINPQTIVAKLPHVSSSDEIRAPSIPPEVEAWIESNQLSSEALRKKA